jgi:protein involved in polysaccharide export with SLBB domain
MLRSVTGLMLMVLLSACYAGSMGGARPAEPAVSRPAAPIAAPPRPAIDGPRFAPWTASSPEPVFLPGDEFDLSVFTAPELNRTVRVGADGRASFPLIGAQVLADRTVDEVTAQLTQAYSDELRDPVLEVIPRTQAVRQIFVGGEVGRPGLIDMPGGIDAFQAVIQAGGWTNAGDASRVVVIRRTPGGVPAMRVIDLRAAARDPALMPDFQLQRFDVVFVPRKRVVDAALWVQQNIRDIIPISFSVSYNLGNTNR